VLALIGLLRSRCRRRLSNTYMPQFPASSLFSVCWTPETSIMVWSKMPSPSSLRNRNRRDVREPVLERELVLHYWWQSSQLAVTIRLPASFSSFFSSSHQYIESAIGSFGYRVIIRAPGKSKIRQLMHFMTPSLISMSCATRQLVEAVSSRICAPGIIHTRQDPWRELTCIN
jgi:hypothetical protein